MSKEKARLHYFVKLALLAAVMLMMDMTGLAMIPLPGQYASIMTVPVAVGAMVLGPLAGGVLGTVMGLISFFTAMKTGFSTLFVIGYTGGIVVLLSFVNSVIPRMLMGVCVGWLFRAVHRIDKTRTVSYYLGGIAAPLVNTLLYMTVLVLIFLNAPMLEALLSPELYEAFRENIFLFVALYVGAQAVIEAVIGCVISGSVCKILGKVLRQ